MSVATAVSRVTGFVRTWAMAVALGVQMTSSGAVPIASSYNIANNIPNMVYELVAGGVLSSMLVPLFMEQLERKGESAAWRFASQVLSVATLALGLVAVAGTFLPGPFVRTQTFTLAPEQAELSVMFFRFFAIQIVFYGVAAILTGVLNSYRRFLAPAAAPVFNNLVVIVTLLGFYLPFRESNPRLAITGLAVGTTLGVLAQMAVQLPSLVRLGVRFTPGIDWTDPALRKMGRKMLPVVAYVAVNLVGVSFRNAFALRAFADGSAALQYAWMWYQLPYGIFAVALATAIFPELSEAAARTDWEAYKRHFSSGLRATGLLVIPIAAMLVALAEPVITLYRAGSFPAEAVALVAGVLRVWGLGLFSFAGFMFLLRAFYSLQDSRTPMITNLLAHGVQIALYWALTSVVAWGDWRLLGIPAADAVAYSLHFALLAIILRRRVGPLDGRRTLSTLGRVLLASIAGAACAWGMLQATGGLADLRFGFLAQLLAGGLAGLGVTYGLAALMRVRELSTVSGMLRRKLAPARTAGVPDESPESADA